LGVERGGGNGDIELSTLADELGGGNAMKLALKLLILMAIVVIVAGLCGGWKWGATPSRTSAAVVHAPTDANG
jgi:hypothetical protein